MKPNTPVFDKVIVITDRVVLDRQLQDTIFQFDHVTGVVQEDRGGLAAARGRADGFGRAQSSSRRCRSSPTCWTRSRCIGRSPLCGDHRRGALVAVRRVGERAEEGARPAGFRRHRRRRRPADRVRARSGTARQPVLLRVHRDPEGQDAGALRHAQPRDGIRPAVPRLLDASGHRRGLHPRRAAQLHHLPGPLAPDEAAVDAAEAADPEVDPGKAKATLVRAAELHPTSQDQRAQIIVDHFRSEVRRPARRPGQGHGGDRVAGARRSSCTRRSSATSGSAT